MRLRRAPVSEAGAVVWVEPRADPVVVSGSTGDPGAATVFTPVFAGRSLYYPVGFPVARHCGALTSEPSEVHVA